MDYQHHARLTIVRREELAKSVLDRATARAEPGHGQPRAAAVEAEPHPPCRAAAATPPL